MMMLGYQRSSSAGWRTAGLVGQGANAMPDDSPPCAAACCWRNWAAGGDAEMRGEMFICGVFSLLDRLLQPGGRPAEEPAGARARAAARWSARAGPTTLPWNWRADRAESLFDIRGMRRGRLPLSAAEVNRACWPPWLRPRARLTTATAAGSAPAALAALWSAPFPAMLQDAQFRLLDVNEAFCDNYTGRSCATRCSGCRTRWS